MKTYVVLAFAGIAAVGVGIALVVRRRFHRSGLAATRASETASKPITLESTVMAPAAGEPPTDHVFVPDLLAGAPATTASTGVDLEDRVVEAVRDDDAAPAARMSDAADLASESLIEHAVTPTGASAGDYGAIRAAADVQGLVQADVVAVVAELEALSGDLHPTASPANDGFGENLHQPSETELDSREPPSLAAAPYPAGLPMADRASPTGGLGHPSNIGSHSEEPRPSATPPDAAELPAADAASLGAEGLDSASDIEVEAEEQPSSASTPRVPRQYQPPRSAPTRPVSRRKPSVDVPASTERRLDIDVRLMFERGGFCRLSLIPQKDERLDGAITASWASGEIELVPLQENFYSDVFPDDLGSALRNGLEWTAKTSNDLQLRWSLGGRDVYVLGQHEHISGSVSMPRVLLGETHVVLCTDERAAQVSEIITASGSSAPTVIQQAEGLPAGWTAFNGVSPTISIPQSGEHDILNILRPRPDISIALEGGIRIGRNTWLAEYPPQVRIRGNVATETSVLIDGVGAERTEAGTYVVRGWDAPGDHSIWCADLSRTYEIRAGLETWSGWDAYRWSLEGVGADGVVKQPSLCGPLVRAPRSAAISREPRVVSTRNPVLIGAMPGEITRANMRTALRSREGLASVPFDPVWALPADPFHCDKATTRVIALASQPPVEDIHTPRSANQQELRARRAWCDAILDAARKRLGVEPDDPETRRLWAEYRRHAKALRKRLR